MVSIVNTVNTTSSTLLKLPTIPSPCSDLTSHYATKVAARAVSVAQVGTRPVFTVEPDTSEPRNGHHVIVLGNAYGIMDYQIRVSAALAGSGFSAHWFPFSGQHGFKGKYGLKDPVNDLGEVTEHLRTCFPGAAFHLLAHCGSSIIATEYFKLHGVTKFDTMAIYGLLYNPARRRDVAVTYLRFCGVEHEMTDEIWDYPWKEKLQALQLPILICHGEDAVNQERATREEINQIARELSKDTQYPVSTQFFETGYESLEERSWIIPYVKAYESHFLGKDQIAV